jgi:basic membrane protein A and related proteins
MARTRRLRLVLVAAAVAVAATLAAGCAGGADGSGSGADVHVALVTDIGGLNDRGFNALANKGLERAESQSGIQGARFISKAANDYVRT